MSHTPQSSNAEEHIDLHLPNVIKDKNFHGGNLEIRFPCTRIPEWCSHWRKGSSITIQPRIQDDSSRTWMGIVLFVVFVIKHENFDEGSDLEETCFRFYADEVLLENPLDLEGFQNFKVGSYGLCVFVPQMWFGEQLNKTSHIKASFSTNREDVDVKMCGLHVIFDQDVSKFTRDLVEAYNEHENIQHYMQLLNEATKLETENNVKNLSSDKQPTQFFVVTHPNKRLIRHLQALISTIFQGRYARKYPMPFGFSTTRFGSNWFFQQSVGRFVVCYLPKNLFDDKSWVGFSLFVVLKMLPSDLDKINSGSETRPVLHIDLHTHGSSISHITTFTDLPILPYSKQVLLFNTPRVYFGKELNQCWGVSTLFRTSIPDVEVETCGIRVVYEKDLGDVVNMITQCELNSTADEHKESRYQLYAQLGEYFCSIYKVQESNTGKEEMPINSREYAEQFLSSTQPGDKQVLSTYEELSVPCDPIVVHSEKLFFEYSNQVIEETSRDSAYGLFHLQIMAETPLYEDEYLINRWKYNLKDLLQLYIRNYYVIITFSIKGRIISLLKPFNPFNTYNLCFPRKEIIEWFEGYQFSNRRVPLPPNLKTDKKWRGIAVCAAFTVQEHPNAIVDDQDSEISSFRLLCHLSMDKDSCLNPVSTFRITKDKFKGHT